MIGLFKHLAKVGEELNVPVDRRTIIYRGTESLVVVVFFLYYVLSSEGGPCDVA